MIAPSHQTVRLARGRHASRHAGVCVMELASMLAHEPFSDRAPSISPTIGAFLRTYNDGLDEDRRQVLYSVAAAIVGTASTRAVERERISRCLWFATTHGRHRPGPHASLALATPEPAGSWAAIAALDSDAHADALALVDELVALGRGRRALLARIASAFARGRKSAAAPTPQEPLKLAAPPADTQRTAAS